MLSPLSARTVAGEQAALLRARAEADAALRRSAGFEQRARAARSQAARTAAKKAAVSAAIEASRADIRAAEARIALVEAARRRQAERLAAVQAPAVRLAAALQTLARRPPALALVEPGSIGDLVHVRMLLAAALPTIRARSVGLRIELARAEQLRAQAALAARTLADGRAGLERRRAELAALETGQQRAARRYVDLGLDEQDRAAALGEKARDIVDLMEEQGREDEVRTRLADLPGPFPRPDVPGLPPGAPPALSGAPALRLPVPGRLVTGLDELFDSGVRSKGLTLATADDAPVVAPGAGRIAFAGPFRHYRRIVILDHGGGWTTLVTGLARVGVKLGDTVAAGDPLGRAPGDDPRVTTELRHLDQPIDIVPLLTG